MVICRRSSYFHGLCGHDAKFEEARKKTVGPLQGESAAVQEYLLRYLYGAEQNSCWNDPTNATMSSLRNWVVLRIAADKYLLPMVNQHARKPFLAQAAGLSNSDEIVAFSSELKDSHNQHNLAEAVRKIHIVKIFNLRSYRVLVEQDHEPLANQLDALAFSVDLKVEYATVCRRHPDQW